MITTYVGIIIYLILVFISIGNRPDVWLPNCYSVFSRPSTANCQLYSTVYRRWLFGIDSRIFSLVSDNPFGGPVIEKQTQPWTWTSHEVTRHFHFQLGLAIFLSSYPQTQWECHECQKRVENAKGVEWQFFYLILYKEEQG